LIAQEMGAVSGDVESWAVANALMGVQRALVTYVRSSVLAGKRGKSLAADTRYAGERSFAVLAHGLRDYALKQGADVAADDAEPVPDASRSQERD
jgi:hypothetical protein